MPTEIESLQIKIQADAVKANDAIDRLDDKLERLEKALSGLERANLTGFAHGVERLSKAMVSMNQVKTTDFTRLEKNLANLSTVNVAGLNSSASSVMTLSKAFNELSTATQNANNISVFASALSKLGNKGVQNAIVNIPQLSKAMSELLTSLARAPKVSQGVIDVTNALANLTAQSTKVGRASTTMVSGLNRTTTAMARTRSQATSLASAFGKFYASYFMIIRGVKGLWGAIEDSMDYVETYNYFNVALGKIGEETAERFGEFGKQSAENYAKEFGDRLNELNKKMTGYIVDDEGALQLAGDMGLGLNIQQMMNFQAKVLSVTNSVGLMGEASVSTAKAVSMLAGDISSLTNVDIESVMESLTSGLIGQSRALYKYGIDITNNTLQQYAYAEGIDKAVSEMTQSEKMQLRLLAILDQSEVAWGDLGHTVDSVANQYRIFQQQVGNLGRTFGNLFLPIVKNVLPYVNGLVIALNNLFTSLGFSIYGDTWLNDLQDGISGGIQGDIEDLEDGMEEADDAAKQLKKSLSSFDELDVISLGGVSSAKDAEGVIDLTESIADALGKYEVKWNEAFENATGKAGEFAKALTEIFQSANITNGFKEIVESVKEFSDVIEPFTQGAGDGFINFFVELSKISLDAFTKSLDSLGEIVGDVDPETLEKLGTAIGSFAGALAAFLGVSGVATKISAAISTIATALTAHPVLTGIGVLTTLVGGLLSYGDALEDASNEKAKEDAKEFAKQLEELYSVFDKFSGTMGDISTKRDGVVQALEDYFKLLNDDSIDYSDKEQKLRSYVSYITGEFSEVGRYVDAHTGLFTANKEEILANIDAVTQYAKAVAAQSLLTEAYKEYYEAYAEGRRLLNEYQALSEDYLSKYDPSAWFKSKEQKKAEKELDQAYKAYILYQDKIVSAQEKIKGIEEINASLAEQYNPLDAIVDGANDSVEGLENVEGALIDIGDELDVLGGKEITIPVNLELNNNLLAGFNKYLNLPTNIPMHYTGGFPEDGLFMANHNELVGRFSNGKTAVANNQQIIEGIKQGVFEAVTAAMQGNGTNVNVTLEGDANGLFRVVRNKANEYYNVNGRPAFNM